MSDNYTVIAEPTVVNASQGITVSWTASSSSPGDWIGVSRDGGESWSDGHATNGQLSGSFIDTSQQTAGTFVYGYLSTHNGLYSTALSTLITVLPLIIQFSAPSQVAAGASITVTCYVEYANRAADSIGLFAQGAADANPIAVQAITSISASYVFTMPSTAGNYEFRYLLEGTTGIQTCEVAVASATLILASNSVEYGTLLSVDFTAINPTSNDHVTCNPAPGNTYNVAQSSPTRGASQGTITFSQPWGIGDYILSYLFNDQTTLAQVTVTIVEAVPPVPQISLAVTPASVAPNVALTVNWLSSAAEANDWIGLYSIADPDALPVSSQAIGNGTSGVLNFTAPDQEGHYEFRYYVYGQAEPAAHSNLLAVLVPQVSLSVTPDSVPSGALITVSWEAVNGSEADTIGLFAVTADDAHPLSVQTTQSVFAGSLQFIAPDQFTQPRTPGQYEFRYFFAGSVVAAANSNAVTVILPQVVLTVTPLTVEPGGQFSVSWNASNSTNSDQIGLYPIANMDGLPSISLNTYGILQGGLTFIAPTQAGQYLFRYLLNGDTSLAYSDIVAVYDRSDVSTTVADSLPDAVPRATLEKIISNRAIHDGQWRDLLISNPIDALTQLFGKAPPSGLNVNVLVEDGNPLNSNDAGQFYFVVSSSANKVIADEEGWVVNPVVPPEELQSNGIDERGSELSKNVGTQHDISASIENQQRGIAAIASNLNTLDDSVTSVALTYTTPMAFNSRADFKAQVDYLLFTSPSFYSSFVANPRQAIEQQFNFLFPEEVSLTACVETDATVYVVLPYPPFDAIFTPPYAVAFQSASNNYIAVPANGLAITEAITVEVWFKATAFHYQSDNDDVLVSTYQSGGGWKLLVSAGIPRFVVNINGLDVTAQSDNPRLILHPDRWYYLAGVYDGAQVQLYLNDLVLSPATAASGQIGPNTDTLTLACTENLPSGQLCFQGLIYDVRIWSEALSLDRLKSDFLNTRSETPVPQDNLCAWYPMLEGTGMTLYDHSGNNNHGTLHSVVWVSTFPDTPN